MICPMCNAHYKVYMQLTEKMFCMEEWWALRIISSCDPKKSQFDTVLFDIANDPQYGGYI